MLQKTLQKTLQKKDLDIIRLMRENPSISTAAIAEKLKVSRQTVATHVKSLQDVGVISRVGPDKGGRWVVNLRK